MKFSKTVFEDLTIQDFAGLRGFDYSILAANQVCVFREII